MTIVQIRHERTVACLGPLGAPARYTWWWTAARRRLGVRYIVDRDHDYRASTFLAGTARSGTTWVSELINHDNQYRYVFEPFDERKIPAVASLGGRRYVRPSDDSPELYDLADYVLSGRIRHPWTERFNHRIVTTRRLIKDVRANLFLAWMHRQFPELPIVLVVREPFATAVSYERQGWRGDVEALLRQQPLMNDFLAPHRDAIAGAADAFERALFIWCVETLVPLTQLRPGDVHLMFYEHLVRDTEGELRRLFAFIGREFDPAVLRQARRPSLTTRRNSRVAAGDPPTLTDAAGTRDARRRRERTREITRRFGLDTLYTEDGLPNAARAEALMRAARLKAMDAVPRP